MRSYRKETFAFVAFALLSVLADQGTKALAALHLKAGPAVEVIPGFFQLCYVENRGAAWGMMQGWTQLLAGFSILTLVWLVWQAKRLFFPFRAGWLIAALLSGGIAGNLVDRLFRGCVVDFLDFHWRASHFPAFNVADSCICAGVGLFLLAQLFSGSPDEENNGKRAVGLERDAAG